MKKIARQLDSGNEKEESAAHKRIFNMYLIRMTLQVLPILLLIFFSFPDPVATVLKIFSTLQYVLLLIALAMLFANGYAAAFGKATGIALAKVGMSLDFFIVCAAEIFIIALFGMMQYGMWMRF